MTDVAAAPSLGPSYFWLWLVGLLLVFLVGDDDAGWPEAIVSSLMAALTLAAQRDS